MRTPFPESTSPTQSHRLSPASEARLGAPPPDVVLLVGPTAAGKSAVAIALARAMGGEVVSLDSRTFYRGMDIGTAKPSAQERAVVPHHLIDIAAPNNVLSLADFQRMATDSIRGILRRSHLPILVGGTGQYVRALTAGWVPPRVPPNERMRAVLTHLAAVRGGLWLHRRLEGMDPTAANSIEPRNTRRTIRALEVILTTGERFSKQRRQSPSQFHCITIGLSRSREDLYARIDARIEQMWSSGLLDEVRGLLKGGVPPDAPALSAIGYVQCVRVIQGKMDQSAAKAEMRRLTRKLVRRQSNWFKETDPSIKWFDAGRADLVRSILEHVRASMMHAPEDPPTGDFS